MTSVRQKSDTLGDAVLEAVKASTTDINTRVKYMVEELKNYKMIEVQQEKKWKPFIHSFVCGIFVYLALLIFLMNVKSKKVLYIPEHSV